MKALICYTGFGHNFEVTNRIKGKMGNAVSVSTVEERCTRCGKIRTRKELDFDIFEIGAVNEMLGKKACPSDTVTS